jgi:hypothetical protein
MDHFGIGVDMSALQQMLLAGAVGAGAATDPNFSSVVLLMHMDGASGSTTYTDSSPSAHTVTGAVPQSTAAFKFGSASADFASVGDTQYLQTSDSADWAFGSGQFTIESFVRFTTAPNGGTVWGVVTQFGGGSNLGWFLGVVAGEIGFYYSTSGGDSPHVGAAWAPTTGVWYHVAVDRDSSNVLRVYVDGVVKASATVASTFFDSSRSLIIGNDENANRKLLGYMDEVRITKGVARYAGAFTPPTAAFPNAGGTGAATDPYFSSVKLLCHFDGTDGQTATVDSSASPHVLTNNSGVVLSSARSKFGATSAYFAGAGGGHSWITPDSADWTFGSGQFTIEGWIYVNSWGSYVLAGQWGWSSQLGWDLEVSGSAVTFRYSTDGMYNGISFNGAWSPSINTWYHIAVDRDASNVIRIYADGVVLATTTDAATFWDSTNALEIGCTIAGSTLNGYLDEVRITKGVARYAGAFTPPTAAFPNS